MLCHCARLSTPHEHIPSACTSSTPVRPCFEGAFGRWRNGVQIEATRDGMPIEVVLRESPVQAMQEAAESLNEMSVRAMQEQAAEEAAWADKLRPQIERELRQRIADEMLHDPKRGIIWIRQLQDLAPRARPGEGFEAVLGDILLHIEHWAYGIRDGSVGRNP